jgi:hypothetical protein
MLITEILSQPWSLKRYRSMLYSIKRQSIRVDTKFRDTKFREISHQKLISYFTKFLFYFTKFREISWTYFAKFRTIKVKIVAKFREIKPKILKHEGDMPSVLRSRIIFMRLRIRLRVKILMRLRIRRLRIPRLRLRLLPYCIARQNF